MCDLRSFSGRLTSQQTSYFHWRWSALIGSKLLSETCWKFLLQDRESAGCSMVFSANGELVQRLGRWFWGEKDIFTCFWRGKGWRCIIQADPSTLVILKHIFYKRRYFFLSSLRFFFSCIPVIGESSNACDLLLGCFLRHPVVSSTSTVSLLWKQARISILTCRPNASYL